MKKGLMIIAVLALGFSACKKDSDDGGTTPPKTTSEKIIGTWKGDQVVILVKAPAPIGDTTITEDWSYTNVEFKADGTAVADSAGVSQGSINWSLIGDTQMLFDGDTMDIVTLNDTQFYFGRTDIIEPFPGILLDMSTTFKLKK